MTWQQSSGDLSLIDEAVVRYHAAGQDFIAMFDYFLNFRAPNKRYIYSAPDYLMLFQEVTDEEHGRHWQVAYAASRKKNAVRHLMDIAPYRLDIIAFSRYRHLAIGRVNEFKYYNWDRLYRHGLTFQQTKGTTPSSTTPATTSSSCASSEDTDS